MSRGFEPATSAPRASNTGSRGQAQQSSASPSSPYQLKPVSRSDLTVRELSEPNRTSTGRKSPAYLQEKNHYGEKLDRVEHPYKDSKPAAARPPSQLESSIEGRPRPSGSSDFTTRPVQPEPERTITAPATQLPPLSSRQTTPMPGSVKAARKFFERKTSQGGAASSFPHTTSSAGAKGAKANPVIKDPQPRVTSVQQSQEKSPCPTRIASPSNEPALTREYLDPTLPIPRPEQEAVKRVDASQRINPFVRQQPKLVLKTATVPKDVPLPKSSSPFEDASEEHKSVPYEKSKNDFEEPSRAANSLTYERRAVDGPSGEESKKVSQFQPSENSVRRQSTRKLLTATKTNETLVSENPKRSDKIQSSEADRGVRNDSIRRMRSTTGSGSISTQHSKSPETTRGCKKSCSALLIPQERANILGRQSRKRSTSPTTANLDQDIETFVHNSGEPIDSVGKLHDIAAKNLSHDHSSPHHNFSRHVSPPGAVPATTLVVNESYFTNDVPYDVDFRSGFGRRKTSDFGFPGANIKPRSTFRTYQPLEDPGSWIKRLCGHFSNFGAKESREEASLQPCHQCRAKWTPPLELSQKYHKAWRRTFTDSSVASTCRSKMDYGARCHSSIRRQNHSECMPSDRCGDAFAKDLGTIIDAILEEHAKSLDHVISNIRSSQPPLENLQRISADFVQRTQPEDPCSKPCRFACQYLRENSTSFSPCNHQQICRPVYEPIYQSVCLPNCRFVCQQVCQSPSQTICEYSPPCPYILPKLAEKLNVGEPGQVGPNLNDSRESLQKTTESMTDLINLVNSAADDLGVDLEERPSVQEERSFSMRPWNPGLGNPLFPV